MKKDETTSLQKGLALFISELADIAHGEGRKRQPKAKADEETPSALAKVLAARKKKV